MLRDVRPEKIYGPEIRRFVRYNVPPLARAARGMGRDLLIDSLKLTKEFDPASIRSAGARIGEAFFVYQSRLRDIIRLRFNRDIRLVGVLHPSQPGTPDEVLLLREYIKASWAREEARVIDGDTTDIVKALVSERSWVNGETAA